MAEASRGERHIRNVGVNMAEASRGERFIRKVAVNMAEASREESFIYTAGVTMAEAPREEANYVTPEVENAAKKLAREFREAARKLESEFHTTRQRIERGINAAIIGGVVAIGALALAPFTAGTSLIAAAGAAVCTAVSGSLYSVVSRILFELFSSSKLREMNEKLTTFRNLYKLQIDPLGKETFDSWHETLEDLIKKLKTLDDLREEGIEATITMRLSEAANVARLAYMETTMEDIIRTSMEVQMEDSKYKAHVFLYQFAFNLETLKGLDARCSFCSRYIASTRSQSSYVNRDILSPISGRRPKVKDLPPPIFSWSWEEKQHFDRKGGHLQKDGSDVILRVPANAVTRKGGVEVRSAVSVDVGVIRNELKLSDEEHVVSPLAEFWAGPDFRFQTSVSITLPHCLPKDFDPKHVSVYHVMSNDGTNRVETSRLNQIKPESDGAAAETLTEPDVSEKKEHCFQVTDGHITVFTKHFCGYVCTYCEKKEKAGPKYKPRLFLMASGSIRRQEAPDLPNLPSRVDVYAHIWDSRMHVKDFRTEHGIRQGQVKDIKLLSPWKQQHSKLHLELRCTSPLTHRLDNGGNPLQSEPQSIDLCPWYGCEDCARNGLQTPISHHWAMEVDSGHLTDEVAVDVTHETTNQQTTTLVLNLKETDGADPDRSSSPNVYIGSVNQVNINNT